MGGRVTDENDVIHTRVCGYQTIHHTYEGCCMNVNPNPNPNLAEEPQIDVHHLGELQLVVKIFVPEMEVEYLKELGFDHMVLKGCGLVSTMPT